MKKLLNTLKFIGVFIAAAAVAFAFGWCVIQVQFMIRPYTDFGVILHYVGVSFVSLLVGLFCASSFVDYKKE